MRRRIYKSPLIIMIALVLFGINPVPILAETMPSGSQSITSQKITEAQNFIQAMGDDVIDYISNKELGSEERKNKLDTILRHNFDTNTISRFTLGRYWRTLTPAEQEEYQRLYQDMIVAIYADKFSDYNGEQFVVSRAGARGEQDFIVQSQIIRPENKDIDVNWRIRLKNGSYKIIDVAIEDVSMIITQKADFASIIQRNGGQASAIIDHLRNKTR